MLKQLRQTAKTAAKRLASALGYALVRTDSPLQLCTMAGALRAIARRKTLHSCCRNGISVP